MGADIVLSSAENGERNPPPLTPTPTASVNTTRGGWGSTVPHIRIVWMNSDVPATKIISKAQAQPIVRCGSVPFGAKSCNSSETDRGEGESGVKTG